MSKVIDRTTRYCPMCNRVTENAIHVHDVFRARVCGTCGHIHSISEVRADARTAGTGAAGSPTTKGVD